MLAKNSSGRVFLHWPDVYHAIYRDDAPAPLRGDIERTAPEIDAELKKTPAAKLTFGAGPRDVERRHSAHSSGTFYPKTV